MDLYIVVYLDSDLKHVKGVNVVHLFVVFICY